MIAPTSPTVCAAPVLFADAWVASSMVVSVATPNATPAAANSAISSTAIPVAVSHPKNADPTLIPPNRSFCRATIVARSGTGNGKCCSVTTGWCVVLLSPVANSSLSTAGSVCSTGNGMSRFVSRTGCGLLFRSDSRERSSSLDDRMGVLIV